MARLLLIPLFVLSIGALPSCRAKTQALPEAAPMNTKPTVVAMGRLGPVGGVIKLSVPNAADSRVNQILVREGDRVQANQVIAILQGSERRERDLAEAIKTVEYYQARLLQAQAGTSKQADVTAQRTKILRLEADWRTQRVEKEAAIASAQAERREAEATYERQFNLASSGAISQQALDQARRNLETTRATVTQKQAQLANLDGTLQQQIALEQDSLAQLQEVRPVDVRVAQAELERAKITVEQRRTDLKDSEVRVPIAGQILRINTRVGEQVNTQQGIVEIGKTDQMYTRAEVYETEVSKIKPGQRATLSSEYGGFSGEVQGTVEKVGLQVGAAQVVQDTANPSNDTNQRVVAVDIRIDPEDNDRVATLTNVQVRVEIEVGPTLPKEQPPNEQPAKKQL